jgi:hypothetical protein
MLGWRLRAIVDRHCHPGRRAPTLAGKRAMPTMEAFMSAADKAFILTGELFVLSFAVIVAFWFADKLRRNLTGKP